MTKAIILTSAEVTEEEDILIRTTRVFKVAINHHADELYPTVRFTSDYVTDDLKRNFTQPVFCTRSKAKNVTTVSPNTLGSSIADCVRWLDKRGFKSVLLVATNKVHSPQFRDLVYTTVADGMYRIRIYKYTEDGFFDAPYMSVKEYLTTGEKV